MEACHAGARKPRSAETKAKMRKPKSAQHRLNISKAMKARLQNGRTTTQSE